MSRAALVISVVLLTAASADPPSLFAVRHPGLEGLDPAVQRQIEERRSALTLASKGPDAAPDELAEAYGSLGMLYQLYEFMVAAEQCYANAENLVPEDYRWPYLTGHVQLNLGDLDQASSSFERALAIRPDDVPALIWLGEVRRTLTDHERASALFARALELDEGCMAALVGLGKTALDRGDPQGAVTFLTSALQQNSNLPMVHYNLGMALRDLGETDKARRHLEIAASRSDSTRDIDPIMAGLNDPLLFEVQALTTGVQAHRSRAAAAMSYGRPDAAAAELRKALELDPSDPVTRAMLADTLVAQRDHAGAAEQLALAASSERTAPAERAGMEIRLAGLYELLGRYEDAEGRYRSALADLPERADAASGLARVLLLTDRPIPALEAYDAVLAVRGDHQTAHFWRSMTLLRLHRWSEAKAAFEAGLALRADDGYLLNGLARLLAACPDDDLRDGVAALALIQGLADLQRLTPGQAETLAMALAETGDFAGAILWQERLIDRARHLEDPGLVQRLTDDLSRYRRGEASRVPWPDDDPIFLPPPGG